jgi:hypothetical protein
MIYELTVPASIKSLRNLSNCLEKAGGYADSKKTPMEVLLTSRLAIDQFPLTRQIQIACDTAKLGASRLSGQTAPTHDDSEKTLPEIQARIKSTISYLESLNKDQFKGAEQKQISTPRWEGKWLTGEEFATQHLLPNLYFHVTTAYAILRHNGVEVGKTDYLGEMPFKK